MRFDGRQMIEVIRALRRDGLAQTGSALGVLVAVLYALGCAPPPAPVDTPSFTPNGGSFTSSVDVAIATTTDGATIRYTLDGTDPTSVSTEYTAQIHLVTTTTVKARAFKMGMTDSEAASATFTVVPAGNQVAAPAFTPNGGSFTSSVDVGMASATSGATIRYTTDGSDPTVASTAYSDEVTLTTTTTLKARAFKAGMTDSEIASADFTVTTPAGQVAAPTFNPGAGEYLDHVTVELATTTSGATIRYTTDGSDPTAASTEFTDDVTLTSTTTVKARAFKAGMTDSAVAAAAYVVAPATTYSFAAAWTGDTASSDTFDQPRRIDVDADGNVYVPDFLNARVVKLGGDGAWLAKLNTGLFDFPAAVAVDALGKIYVAENALAQYRIRVLNPGGTLSMDIGSTGSAPGQFGVPADVAVDASGNVFVADLNDQRVHKFDSSGTFVTRWGSFGTGDSEFNGPLGIAVGASGNVYVADSGNNRIQKFDGSGTFITEWGQTGVGQGDFNTPAAVAVDLAENVYVVDQGNDRVQKFDSAGTFIAEWGETGIGNGQFDRPSGVAVDANGVVYVAERGNNRIQKFTSAP